LLIEEIFAVPVQTLTHSGIPFIRGLPIILFCWVDAPEHFSINASLQDAYMDWAILKINLSQHLSHCEQGKNVQVGKTACTTASVDIHWRNTQQEWIRSNPSAGQQENFPSTSH
jgi:hypothetical protein